MHLKMCSGCGEEFDLKSSAKRKAGGKINECPECSTEIAKKAFAITNVSREDDKEVAVKIVFPSPKPNEAEREEEFLTNFPFRCEIIKVDAEYIYFYVYDQDLKKNE